MKKLVGETAVEYVHGLRNEVLRLAVAPFKFVVEHVLDYLFVHGEICAKRLGPCVVVEIMEDVKRHAD